LSNGLRLGCVVLTFVLFLAQGLAQSTSGSTSGGSGTGSSTSSSGTSGSTSGGSTGSCTTTTRQISLHIPDETVPPGGIVQMKVLVTEPTPTSSGGPSFALLSGLDVSGIELFNPNGDVNGVAMIGTSMISIQSITSTGTQGSDYPIMVASFQVPPDLGAGTKLSFSLDPSSTWTLGLLGAATMKPIAPATITIGGSISITDVIPGGGIQPAGTVIHVQGIGFQPGTQVQLSNIKSSSITVISPQEIQIVLAEPAQMTGKKIQVTNPDGSQDTYFSYMRGIPFRPSGQPLLASAIPIFSSVTYSQAVFASADTTTSEFTGIAVQDPNLGAATVTFTLFASPDTPLGSSTVVIPSGNRMMNSMAELTGVTPPQGSYLVVRSDTAVQMFAFLADNVTQTVAPYVALSTQP
jgi:hypothetical protein